MVEEKNIEYNFDNFEDCASVALRMVARDSLENISRRNPMPGTDLQLCHAVEPVGQPGLEPGAGKIPDVQDTERPRGTSWHMSLRCTRFCNYAPTLLSETAVDVQVTLDDPT